MERELLLDIGRSIEGDRGAFERLIRRYRSAIRGFLQQMVGDFHLAQDLAQETFLKAFASLKNLDSPGCFRAWLFRIAFHVAVDYRRSRGHAAVSLESMPGRLIPDGRERATRRIDDEDERAMRYRDVVRALATLPEEYGLPMVLRYFQQRSYFEVSHLLDISLNNVKVRLHRARKMIRRRVAAKEMVTVRFEERSER